MSKSRPDKRNIKAVILAGNFDFGRCPLSSCLPPALWPVADKPVLKRLLLSLSSQGVKQAVICSNGYKTLLQKHIGSINSMRIDFLDQSRPVGTAGCIRDAADGDPNTLLLVLSGQITFLPNINTLLSAHSRAGSDLTVVLEPSENHDKSAGKSAGIYICRSTALKYVNTRGYCDIKQGLIPVMQFFRCQI